MVPCSIPPITSDSDTGGGVSFLRCLYYRHPLATVKRFCCRLLPFVANSRMMQGRKEGPRVDDLTPMLTVQDVTRLLQVHEETVRRWIRTGELPAALLGSAKGGYRITRDDYERFV